MVKQFIQNFNKKHGGYVVWNKIKCKKKIKCGIIPEGYTSKYTEGS
jgi:hypothetical protein